MSAVVSSCIVRPLTLEDDAGGHRDPRRRRRGRAGGRSGGTSARSCRPASRAPAARVPAGERVARGEVVADRVAGIASRAVLAVDPPPGPADHRGQLELPVALVGVVGQETSSWAPTIAWAEPRNTKGRPFARARRASPRLGRGRAAAQTVGAIAAGSAPPSGRGRAGGSSRRPGRSRPGAPAGGAAGARRPRVRRRRREPIGELAGGEGRVPLVDQRRARSPAGDRCASSSKTRSLQDERRERRDRPAARRCRAQRAVRGS